MMTTFGLAIVLENIFVLYFSADTRSIERDYATVPLALGPISVPLVYVIGFAISVCAILLVHLVISRTGFGRDLRASAVDPNAAAAVGVDVRRVHALTFALGAACAAAGGSLIGIIFSFTPASGANYLLTDFAIVVLGGMGNIFGTLIGGILLGVLQSLAGITLGDGYRDLVGLVLFLAVLAARPQGLFAGHTA
jgi:branched-chain amino acid transport system permease protein